MFAGVQIIDCKGLDITQEQTIEGVYDIVEGSDKPIFIENFQRGVVEGKPCYCNIKVNGTDFNAITTVTVNDNSITFEYLKITDDDTIRLITITK